MARLLDKTTIAIYASIILAFSSSGHGLSQSPDNTQVDTDSQRWLPSPNPAPMQPNGEVRYLSRLQNRVLNNELSNKLDASRLSNAQVKSLLEAMRQFGDKLPEGLTPESLDAIPPELISKALSDPELRRQAKEMAEEYAKKDRADSSGDLDLADVFGPNELSPARPDAEGKQSPTDPTQPATKQKAAPESPNNAKDDKFKELFEKLQDVRQQVSKGQNLSSESNSQEQPKSISGTPANSNKESPRSPLPSAPEQQAPTTRSGGRQPTLKQPGAKQLDSTPSGDSQNGVTPNGNAPSRPRPSSSGAGTNAENRSRERPQRTDDSSNKQSTNLSQVEPDPFESTPGQPQMPSNNTDVSTSTGEPNSKSSMDIKKELARRGFGPTLQKLVEEAQRKSHSTRGNTTPQNQIAKPTIAPESSSRTARASNAPRPQEPATRPANPDSAFAKGFQQTSKFLNNLWMQIAKNEQIPPRASASPSISPQTSAPQEAFSLPNPFNARALEYLVGMVALGAIAFFVLRFRSRSEHKKRELLEAQLAPRIDEIRTREDVVRAFHALAKQRLQATQAWWTCGYVTNLFEQSLPQHTSPIRTLAGLYEQARYFPKEHGLTVDQIEHAKHALKQCKG